MASRNTKKNSSIPIMPSTIVNNEGSVVPRLTSSERVPFLLSKIKSKLMYGWSKEKIIDYLMKDGEHLGFNYSRQSALNLIKDAKHEMKLDFENDKTTISADIYSKLFHLYEKNYNKEDYAEARNCLKDIAKLTGLDGKQTVEINNADNQIKISFGFGE